MTEAIDETVVVNPPQAEADELAQVFEEQITGDAPEPSATEIALLEDASVSLEWLRDLHYTISREGVSADDVRMLVEIRQTIQRWGVPITPSPSLESYTSAFTQERSWLNQNVSQESILSTIIDTLKAWLSYFKEYLIKAIRFVRNMQAGDEAVRNRVERAAKAVDKIREATFKMRKYAINQSAHDADLLALAKSLLADKTLPRNNVTVALLNEAIPMNNRLVQYHAEVKQIVAIVNQTVAGLVAFFDGKVDQPPLSLGQARRLQTCNAQAAEWLMASPNGKWVVENTEPDVFLRPLNKGLLEPLAYDFVVEAYQSASDFLRKVNVARLNVPTEMQSLVITQAINFMNDAYLELGKLIPFYVEINKTRLRIIAMFHRYWNAAYTHAYNDLQANTLLTEAQRATTAKLEGELKRYLSSLGLV